MTIIDNRPNTTTKFKDLCVGECFTYDGQFYLKTDLDCLKFCVFNLTFNCADKLGGEEIVTPVNAKVVIE